MEIERAVKTAVAEEENGIEPAPENETPEQKWLAKNPWHGVNIMEEMKEAHDDPVGNGLSAAAAAGIDLAR